MTELMRKEDGFHNPLDLAEMVFMDRDLSFDRSGVSDLLAESTGMWGNYRLWLAWQEEFGGLSFTCMIDTKLPKHSLPRVHALLATVNERMWIGHFTIDSECSQVMFKHTMLVKDEIHVTPSHMQEMLDVAVNECDRFFPALQAVVWGGKSPREALEVAMFETLGEC